VTSPDGGKVKGDGGMKSEERIKEKEKYKKYGTA